MPDDIVSEKDKPLPDWVLDESLEFVTVTFPTDPPAAIELQALEVERMLVSIGDYRSVMDPPVAADCAAEQDVSAISNPRWHTEIDRSSGEISLYIRDPRFGWLRYVIPQAEADRLAAQLRSQAAISGR